MKKVKALIAMVALVATIGVASVASAQTVTLTGTVSAINTIGPCEAALVMVPASIGTINCTIAYASNGAHTITYSAGGTATLAGADPIPASAGLSAGTAGWNFLTLSVAGTDTNSTPTETIPTTGGTVVATDTTSQAVDGDLVLTFRGAVSTTTASGTGYDNTGSITII